MNALFIRKTIEVKASMAVVWEVLTNSELIKQYMFGCTAESDWKPGSSLLWKGASDGKLYVKGHIVSIESPHRLVYTTFDPNSAMRDIPANYLMMTYSLKEIRAGVSLLEISQGDFSKVEDGPRRHKETLDGGDAVTDEIKKLAEALATSAAALTPHRAASISCASGA